MKSALDDALSDVWMSQFRTPSAVRMSGATQARLGSEVAGLALAAFGQGAPMVGFRIEEYIDPTTRQTVAIAVDNEVPDGEFAMEFPA